MQKFLCAVFLFSMHSFAFAECVEANETTCKAEEQATKDTNQIRSEVGSRALRHDPKYSAVARDWSKQQHDGACGGDIICHDGFPDARVQVYVQKFHSNPNFMGENVAMTSAGSLPSVGSDFIDMWRNSQGHYENMVDPSYTVMGNGFYCGENGCFGTQIFGE